LFKIGREIRAEIQEARPAAQACACGCKDFMFETEEQATINEIRHLNRRKRR
jgi:hypothetical protein